MTVAPFYLSFIGNKREKKGQLAKTKEVKLKKKKDIEDF